jgi:ribosome maturation factor RimP
LLLDGDNGVLVDDCIFISRAIEHNLDREEQDFSLEVTSCGATSPLQFPRQYNKHIGRHSGGKNCQEGEKLEGVLEGVNDRWYHY